MDELNELEKLGLAFLCGLTAGLAFEKAGKEVDENGKKINNEKVIVEKLDGKKAEQLINMMKEWGIE